jgi:hypothetical protein
MKKYIIYNYVENGFWTGTSKGFQEGAIYNYKIKVFDTRLDAEEEVTNIILPIHQGVFEVVEVFRNI